MPNRLIPRKLAPGDTIGVISPAAPTVEPADAFEKGASLLETAGFRIRLLPHARNRQAYLAGSDADRLADLHAAFDDPDVRGILCSRGGYGCMRLLPGLDFERIRHNPKVFIGFSDVTALHIPFYQEAGLVGFYGPMLTSNLINGEPYSQRELFGLVTGKHTAPYTIPNRDTYHCLNPGIAEAPLIGGNLSLLAALCGTPHQPRTEGHLLFIEDWKEKYYSLDRQFQQLKLAGLFDGIAGLLLCDFSDTESGLEPEQDYPLTEQLRRLTGDLDVPVGYGFSVGHGEETATLPIGIRAAFNADSGALTLLEAPVS